MNCLMGHDNIYNLEQRKVSLKDLVGLEPNHLAVESQTWVICLSTFWKS